MTLEQAAEQVLRAAGAIPMDSSFYSDDERQAILAALQSFAVEVAREMQERAVKDAEECFPEGDAKYDRFGVVASIRALSAEAIVKEMG